MIARRGVVERVELQVGEEQVERLDLLAHERVDPVQLLLVLGLGLGIPCHRRCSSCVGAIRIGFWTCRTQFRARTSRRADRPADPGPAGGRLRRRGAPAARRRPRRHAELRHRRRGPGSPTSWPPPGSPTTPSTATSAPRTRWSRRSSTTAPLRLRSYLDHQMAKAAHARGAGAALGRGRAVAGRRRGRRDHPRGHLERRQRRTPGSAPGRQAASAAPGDAPATSRSPRSAAPIPSSTPRSSRTRCSAGSPTCSGRARTPTPAEIDHLVDFCLGAVSAARASVEHRVGVASGRAHVRRGVRGATPSHSRVVADHPHLAEVVVVDHGASSPARPARRSVYTSSRPSTAIAGTPAARHASTTASTVELGERGVVGAADRVPRGALLVGGGARPPASRRPPRRSSGRARRRRSRCTRARGAGRSGHGGELAALERDRGAAQRDADVLTLAEVRARVERGDGAERGERAGADVVQRHRLDHGVLGAALRDHDPAARLEQRIEAGRVRRAGPRPSRRCGSARAAGCRPAGRRGRGAARRPPGGTCSRPARRRGAPAR